MAGVRGSRQNAIGNTFEFSSSGKYKGIGSGTFSLQDDIRSTLVGTAFDVGLDKLRNLTVGLDWQQFTRARSLSYKSKFALQFNSMNSKFVNGVLFKTIINF